MAHPRQLQCFSAACIEKGDEQVGDKLVLPQVRGRQRAGQCPAAEAQADAPAPMSAQAMLSELLGLGREPPYLFVINGPREGGESYTSGVLEFSAPPGRVFAPYWLMQELVIEEGDEVPVVACESVRCVVGPAVTPAASVDWTHRRNRSHPRRNSRAYGPIPCILCSCPPHLDRRCAMGPPPGSRPGAHAWLANPAPCALSRPQEFLEAALKSYSTIQAGTSIAIMQDGHRHWLDVLEVEPAPCASLLGTVDLNVDFAPPKDAPTGRLRSSRGSRPLEPSSGAKAEGTPSAPEPATASAATGRVLATGHKVALSSSDVQAGASAQVQARASVWAHRRRRGPTPTTPSAAGPVDAEGEATASASVPRGAEAAAEGAPLPTVFPGLGSGAGARPSAAAPPAGRTLGASPLAAPTPGQGAGGGEAVEGASTPSPAPSPRSALRTRATGLSGKWEESGSAPTGRVLGSGGGTAEAGAGAAVTRPPWVEAALARRRAREEEQAAKGRALGPRALGKGGEETEEATVKGSSRTSGDESRRAQREGAPAPSSADRRPWERRGSGRLARAREMGPPSAVAKAHPPVGSSGARPPQHGRAAGTPLQAVRARRREGREGAGSGTAQSRGTATEGGSGAVDGRCWPAGIGISAGGARTEEGGEGGAAAAAPRRGQHTRLLRPPRRAAPLPPVGGAMIRGGATPRVTPVRPGGDVDGRDVGRGRGRGRRGGVSASRGRGSLRGGVRGRPRRSQGSAGARRRREVGTAAVTADAAEAGGRSSTSAPSGGLYDELLRDATGADAEAGAGPHYPAPSRRSPSPSRPSGPAEDDSALAAALLADAESQRMRELSDDTALALALSLSAAEAGACR